MRANNIKDVYVSDGGCGLMRHMCHGKSQPPQGAYAWLARITLTTSNELYSDTVKDVCIIFRLLNVNLKQISANFVHLCVKSSNLKQILSRCFATVMLQAVLSSYAETGAGRGWPNHTL